MKVRYGGAFALVTLVSLPVLARDSSRYPYDNFAHAGEYGGTYQGESGIVPFLVNMNFDPTFDGSEREVLREAMRIFVERAGRREILDCTYRGATKDLPVSRDRFQQQLVDAFMLRRMNDLWYPGNAYIARFSEDETAVGLGFLGLFYDRDKPLPGYENRHYLHVALNSDHMGHGSSYWLASDAEYWAGVIGHEFLHNLGYDHPTGYTGSFIDVYGDCVWRNGSAAAPPEGTLGDRVILKER